MADALTAPVCSVMGAETARPLFSGRMLRTAGLCGVLLGLWLLPEAPCHADTPQARPPSALAHTPPAAEDTNNAEEPSSDRAEQARRAVERIFDDPLSGVVVNRTVTVLGNDFYQHFSTRWRQLPQSTRYSISIHERPTARFGSEIWVQYRQQRVFHTFLPPARAATRSISEFAVQHVSENISRRELERLTTHNPDLGPEEL